MKEYLQTIESVDEKGRCMGVQFYRVYDEKNQGLYRSHGISYIKAREMLQDVSGNVAFGLERVMEK